MELKTKILKNLKPKIDEALKLIEKCAMEKQVIFLRHHNDCDGYSAAVALDKIISEKMSKSHFKERDVNYFYRRIPCQAPYYSFEDSTKDISFIYDSMVTKNKEPLLIVVDNGSSIQDYEGLKRLKIFGFKIIVIDHHPPHEIIDEVADIHINPYHVTDTPIISAGTLSSYIEGNLDFVSAVSGILDHMEGEEYKESFESIKGEYSYDYLRSVGEAVDYELQRSGYLDPWTQIRELFLNELGKRDELMAEYTPAIKSKHEESLKTSLKFKETTILGTKIITKIDVFNTTNKGTYPSSGKAVGLLHRQMEQEYLGKEIITLGVNPESITFRASDNSSFDTNHLIKSLKDKDFRIDGGGHAHAGSIRFIQAEKEDILKFIDGYLQ